jgi:hypothetical protein
MVKRVLMIAYHYPPEHGSSGVQRTLKFTRYLGDHGWEPIVIAAHPRAYAQVGDDQLHEIPAQATIKRAFALDTSKHLSFKGAYPRFLALPDRWASWWFGAVPVGLRLIHRLKPSVIWSTYPIATAHLIGMTLARLTKLPWMADFRDSMSEDHYPPDPRQRRISRWIERQTVSRAQQVVFTTPGTLRMYAERYPNLPKSRWETIANGYDEDNFEAIECAVRRPAAPMGHITLLHSGQLYPSERNPIPFFDALALMRANGEVSPDWLRIVLRGTDHDDHYRPMLEARKLSDVVSCESAIPYEQALTEMLSSDGLLVFQGSSCNHQIPAKIYEYLRARRPILALTDPQGDTARLLSACGIDTQTALTDVSQIRGALKRFVHSVRMGEAPIAREEVIASYSRRAQTAELANLLDALCGHPAGKAENCGYEL